MDKFTAGLDNLTNIEQDVIKAFNSTEGIEFAYPTQRFYNENPKNYSALGNEKLDDINEKINKGEKNDNV